MNEGQARQLVESVAQTYDSIADHFDITRTKIWDEFRYFTPFLRKGQRVLDVGCGNGRSLKMFEGQEIEYVGVDSSAAMIEIATNKEYPGVNKPVFMQANALDLSKVPGQFDIVLMIAVLQHIPAQLHDQVISEIVSKMRPGAMLMMTNWNMWQKKFLKMRFPDLLQRLIHPELTKLNISQKDLNWRDFFVRYQKGDNAPVFQRYHYTLTTRYLKKKLNKHGFKIIRCEYVSGFKKRNPLSAKNILTIAQYHES